MGHVPQEHGMLKLVSLRVCPNLRQQVFSGAIQASWPAFMQEDPAADLFFAQPHLDACLDTAFAVVDPAQPEVAVGRAFAVSFTFGRTGREELPDAGWDGVVRWAHADRALGRKVNALSALEITLLPSQRGRGASRVVLNAMREYAHYMGLRYMFAPVRPTAKANEPHTPMAEYAARTREDGLPTDPWLRVHVRAGGRIEKVAPTSMVVPGTLADWRRWTGMAFDTSGLVVVPGALTPVHVSLEQDHAVYVEPNVWVRHVIPG
jgi:GNAT superfamily N-acetyltransferase